jgi:hypothetical protein
MNTRGQTAVRIWLFRIWQDDFRPAHSECEAPHSFRCPKLAQRPSILLRISCGTFAIWGVPGPTSGLKPTLTESALSRLLILTPGIFDVVNERSALSSQCGIGRADAGLMPRRVDQKSSIVPRLLRLLHIARVFWMKPAFATRASKGDKKCTNES